MKKRSLFFLKMVILGALSFSIGYIVSNEQNEQTSLNRTVIRQNGPVKADADSYSNQSKQYYIVKSNGEELLIYRMPEGIIYDSLDLHSIYLPDETEALSEGIIFETFPELLAFLENAMS